MKVRTPIYVRVTPADVEELAKQERVNQAALHAHVMASPFLTKASTREVLQTSSEEVEAIRAAGLREYRTEKLTVRLTMEEAASVEEAAAAFGLSKAEYAYRQVLQLDVRSLQPWESAATRQRRILHFLSQGQVAL